MRLSAYQKRLLRIFLAVNITLFIISAVYAYIIDSADGKDIVGCTMKHMFHIYCPGCGGSRSLVFLFKLRLISAMRAYPPMFFLLFFLFDIDIRAALSIIKDDRKYIDSFKLNSLIIIPIVIMCHFIIRNILLIKFGVDPLGDLIAFYI